MMTRILTMFCLAFCTMLRAASLPVSFNTTTHKIAAPLDLWTVNSTDIYNGLGLAGMSLQSPSSVSITGGSISGIIDLAIADGGTGASTAAGARTNLGLTIGADVQAYSLRLGNLNALTGGADLLPYFSGTSTWATTSLTTFGRSLIDDADAATARATLGLGGAATLSVGTTAGTVAAGDDSRITGAAQKSSNLSDLADAATARSNIGAASTAGTLAQFAATTSAQLAGVLSDETGSGAAVFANSPTLITPALGTPSQANLASATNLPISTGVSGLGTGVATALATPSSANIFAAVTDETGSGSLVGSASPTFTGTVNAGSTIAFGNNATFAGTGATGSANTLTATGSSDNFAGYFIGYNSSGHSYGLIVNAGSTSGDTAFRVRDNAGTTTYFNLRGDGAVTAFGKGSIQLGGADAASPQAVTLRSQGVAAGTTDTAGANTTLDISPGTGTGAGGSFIVRTAPAGSTGSSQNALVTQLTAPSAGGLKFGSSGTPSYIFPFSGTASGTITPSGTGLSLYSYISSTINSDSFAFAGDTGIQTSGSHVHVKLIKSFAPTSGTAIYNHLSLNPTINQTGGASGVTRALFINPTLTSAADFRAIDIVGGNVVLPKTVTGAGTTGAQTINKITGSVNFAAAATSLVVTDSYVTANSIIMATVASNDTTMKSVAVVAGAGSFTIYPNAAPTAETRVNFFITN